MENARYLPISIIALVYVLVILMQGKITMTKKLAIVFLSSFTAITAILVLAYQSMQFFVHNILTFFGICVTNEKYCEPLIGVITPIFIGAIGVIASLSITYFARRNLLSKSAKIQAVPHPPQYPSNLQEAGIRVFNNEPSGSITNLRVELQNIGLIANEKLVGNVFPEDQHIILNETDGVIKPDSIPSGKSEPIVIADIADHRVSFSFNRNAKPHTILTGDGDIEATDFELKIKILGNIDGDRRIERGPFKMRMVMKRATLDNSWLEISFSSEKDARIAGAV
jgi:hypothetical protein